MKFYGNGLVWDKENSKLLCQFENGEYVAKNNREIEILHNLGYKHDEPEQAKEIEEIINLNEKLLESFPEDNALKICLEQNKQIKEVLKSKKKVKK